MCKYFMFLCKKFLYFCTNFLKFFIIILLFFNQYVNEMKTQLYCAMCMKIHPSKTTHQLKPWKESSLPFGTTYKSFRTI